MNVMGKVRRLENWKKRNCNCDVFFLKTKCTFSNRETRWPEPLSFLKNLPTNLYDSLEDGHPEVADVAVFNLKLRMNQNQDRCAHQRWSYCDLNGMINVKIVFLNLS